MQVTNLELQQQKAETREWLGNNATFSTKYLFRHSLIQFNKFSVILIFFFSMGRTNIQNAESTLKWRHNKRDGASNHRRLDCLLNRLFRPRSNKIPKLCVTALCEGNPPVTDEFPSQRTSNAENVSIWWRHDVYPRIMHTVHTLLFLLDNNRFYAYHLELLLWYWNSHTCQWGNFKEYGLMNCMNYQELIT